ncbi:MAG: ABC-three component system middle component 7 [bacterium]
MRLPNKVISFNESVLAILPIILENLEDQDLTVIDLYSKVSKKISSSDFIDALTILKYLKKIELNKGVISYVKRDFL